MWSKGQRSSQNCVLSDKARDTSDRSEVSRDISDPGPKCSVSRDTPGHFRPTFLGPKCPGSEVSAYPPEALQLAVSSEYVEAEPKAIELSETGGT